MYSSGKHSAQKQNNDTKHSSKPLPIDRGMAQGLVLGPGLFILFLLHYNAR